MSKIIKLQGDWIKYRSSSLYIDPLILEFKIRILPLENLVNVFLKSWHPIVEMEQITSKKLKEAVDYWNQLLPIEERLRKLGTHAYIKPGIVSLEDLKQLLFISEKEFNEVLQSFWKELKEKAGKKKKISYWKFIYTDVYEETILRAYITSFLITYGYVTLEIKPLEEEMFLIPVQNPKIPMGETQAVSVPISIDYDSWKKFTEKKS